MTFICGRAGVCALGAVTAKHAGDERLLEHYLRQFKEVLNCISLHWLFVSLELTINSY